MLHRQGMGRPRKRPCLVNISREDGKWSYTNLQPWDAVADFEGRDWRNLPNAPSGGGTAFGLSKSGSERNGDKMEESNPARAISTVWPCNCHDLEVGGWVPPPPPPPPVWDVTHESDLNHSVCEKDMQYQIDPVREENKNHYSPLTQQIVTNNWQVGLLCDLLHPEIPVDYQKFVGEQTLNVH